MATDDCSKTHEYRKIVKPLLEKRRRARMNCSLNQLKAYIVDARKTEISDPSKLEKADILELTVRHLRDLRRQQHAISERADASRYSAGFSECANEVSIYLSALPDLDNGLRNRLVAHLAMCINQMRQMAHPPQQLVRPVPVDGARALYGGMTRQVRDIQVDLPTSSAVSSPPATSRRDFANVWRPWIYS